MDAEYSVDAAGPAPAPTPRSAQEIRIKWQLQESSRKAKDYKRVITISDVHGNLDALESVWNRLAMEVMGEEGLKKAIIVFLGDINDRGPNTRGAIEFILAKRAEGYDIRCIAGNHDFSMAAFVGGERFLSTLKYDGLSPSRHTLEFDGRVGSKPVRTYPGPYLQEDGKTVRAMHPVGESSVTGDCYQADYNEPAESALHVDRGIEDNMHFLGRKWACDWCFGSLATLQSYVGYGVAGVGNIFTGPASDRDTFVRNDIPQEHIEFLMNLPLIEEIDVVRELGWWTNAELEEEAPGLFPKDLNKTRRFICVHAGIMANRHAEQQITALKERKVYDAILHPDVHADGTDIHDPEVPRLWNLILPITGRSYVDRLTGAPVNPEKGGQYIELLHEDLAHNSIVVSGHHGKKVNALGVHWQDDAKRTGVTLVDGKTWRRCISDKSGGRKKDGKTTIEAIVWPDKFIVPDNLPGNLESGLEMSNEGMERGALTGCRLLAN